MDGARAPEFLTVGVQPEAGAARAEASAGGPPALGSGDRRGLGARGSQPGPGGGAERAHGCSSPANRSAKEMITSALLPVANPAPSPRAPMTIAAAAHRGAPALTAAIPSRAMPMSPTMDTGSSAEIAALEWIRWSGLFDG